MPTAEAQRRDAVLRRVRAVQRRLDAATLVSAGVGPAWLAATALVLARLGLPSEPPLVPLGLTAAALALAAAAWLARPRFLSTLQAAVLTDRLAEAGGLLLTRLERPVGAWELPLELKVKALPLPRPDVRRPLAALCAALAFVAVGLAVPRPAPPQRAPSAATSGRAAALAEKLEVLRQEEEVPQALALAVARLEEEAARGTFAAPDWEASDEVAQALERLAARSLARLQRAQDAARALAAADEAGAPAESTRRAREALERELQGASASSAGQRPSEGHGAASPRELQRALEERRERLQRAFAAGKPGPSRRASSPPGAAPRPGSEASPGQHQPGPGPGGGQTPLTFERSPTLDPDRLAFEPLVRGPSPGEPDGPLWGLRAAQPAGPGVRATSPAAGALVGAPALGSGGRRLSARNRALAERYFGPAVQEAHP